ncbi:MAG: hypothetical protein QJR06_10105 [Alicyclobacillaceae bacterium]|nr:hypothetical protein [Alicyclobacillaceae bacterium]
MVWQWLKKKGVQPASGDPGAMAGNVSDWAKEAVIQVLNHKLYGPEVTPPVGYQPKKTMNRAEAAALFDLAMKLLEGCGCGQQPQPQPKPQPQPPTPQPQPGGSGIPTVSVWTPGDSTVLGKAFFSSFKINGDGTVTVRIPTLEELGPNAVWTGGSYRPPRGSGMMAFGLNPGETRTLKMGLGRSL